MQKEIKSGMRGRWTPFKEIKLELMIKLLNEKKKLFLEFLYLWNLMRKLIGIKS